ncbi:VanZ family protein [Actinomadura sp. NPDC047616]|uniref:VanZ family protein n=1 Tax=Actinomadura sp. NPDC047616 TaxID=3155914 RepID=UPI0033D77F6D
MAQVWQSWGQVILVSVLGLPLCAAVVWWRATAGHRGRGGRWLGAIAEVGLVAGTLPWLWMVMTPGSEPRSVRLVPLVDLYDVLRGSADTAVVQVVGNLLVFAALGFFLPLRWRLGATAVGVIACAGSVAIETAQWTLDLGRVSSADDVLINTLGAVLAALVSRPWWRRRCAEPVT